MFKVSEFDLVNNRVVANASETMTNDTHTVIGLRTPITVIPPLQAIADVIKSQRDAIGETAYNELIAFLLMTNLYHICTSDVDSFEKMYEVTVRCLNIKSVKAFIMILEQIETSQVTFAVSRTEYKEIRHTAFELWTHLVRYVFVLDTSKV